MNNEKILSMIMDAVAIIALVAGLYVLGGLALIASAIYWVAYKNQLAP